jgi:hypothetical protein
VTVSSSKEELVDYIVFNLKLSYFSKIKFSELSLDMFRMLQAVEQEPDVGANKEFNSNMLNNDRPNNNNATVRRTFTFTGYVRLVALVFYFI